MTARPMGDLPQHVVEQRSLVAEPPGEVVGFGLSLRFRRLQLNAVAGGEIGQEPGLPVLEDGLIGSGLHWV